MYYLQSRYYDPQLARFINADDPIMMVVPGNGNAENVFLYCDNAPSIYKDPSGYAFETVLDIGSAVWSLVDLFREPSWANAGYLIWDVGSAIIPFVPGAYVAKGGKAVVKVASKVDDFLDGTKFLTGSYRELKKLFKGIKGVEIHHLVEKRFRVLFKGCNVNDFLSIPLAKKLHKTITKRWRNLHKTNRYFKYFKYGARYMNITYTMMEKAIKEVYKDMPQLLDEVLDWFRKNWRK